MDYVLIIIFQFLGITYKVGQQVAALKKTHPESTGKQVMNTYWNEDWNTLAMSFIVLCTDLAVHYVIEKLGIDWSKSFDLLGITTTWASVYLIFSVGIAIILGYKGQDLIYKWLGSAADRLDKEVSNKINS